MKDIPLFTGEYGLASLILREIPHSGRAYILVESVWNGETEAFLQECRSFCRAVGAEELYASWELADLPLAPAWDMIGMACPKAALPKPERALSLEPLTEENGEAFLTIYNRCFRDQPGAATYGKQELQRLYGMDHGWLVRQDGQWAGIAEISPQGLESIAVVPEFHGLGYDLACTVLPMVPRTEIRLKVADSNHRAIRLYTRLGFRQERVLRRWWRLK